MLVRAPNPVVTSFHVAQIQNHVAQELQAKIWLAKRTHNLYGLEIEFSVKDRWRYGICV